MTEPKFATRAQGGARGRPRAGQGTRAYAACVWRKFTSWLARFTRPFLT
ncbi:hypothetical protein QF030_008073 [Streptomyces rishiriensis]|uniref:Uncharacterized protein n=1 Tax=Streptomyces rishiriensis TaxID=68264 RepID=A0ABU0P4Z8_STRRH|nr:hypothetical protein [Streptomyces rishiriensis]